MEREDVGTEQRWEFSLKVIQLTEPIILNNNQYVELLSKTVTASNLEKKTTERNHM